MTHEPPVDGRQLLGWIGRQPNSKTMKQRAIRLGRSSGYPSSIRSWSPEQVADVWHELQAKARRGEFHRGGTRGEVR
jgi:hypothetical protein